MMLRLRLRSSGDIREAGNWEPTGLCMFRPQVVVRN
jgi:hypothetical protein